MGIQGNNKVTKTKSTQATIQTKENIDVNTIDIKELDTSAKFISEAAASGTAAEIPMVNSIKGQDFFLGLKDKTNVLAALSVMPEDFEEMANNLENYDLLKMKLGFTEKTLQAIENDNPAEVDKDFSHYGKLINKYQRLAAQTEDDIRSLLGESKEVFLEPAEYEKLLNTHVFRERELLEDTALLDKIPDYDELRQHALKALNGENMENGNIRLSLLKDAKKYKEFNNKKDNDDKEVMKAKTDNPRPESSGGAAKIKIKKPIKKTIAVSPELKVEFNEQQQVQRREF